MAKSEKEREKEFKLQLQSAGTSFAALPMARAEPARCQMAPANLMSVGCDATHLIDYPIKRRCSEMIVGLIMMLLSSQRLTSC